MSVLWKAYAQINYGSAGTLALWLDDIVMLNALGVIMAALNTSKN